MSLMRSLISKGLAVKGLVDGLISPPLQRWVYNFDGIDDYGVLDTRAINVDGDNTFEFWSADSLSPSQTIIAQNITGVSSAIEFRIFIGSSSGLELTFGGSVTSICTIAQGLLPSKKYGLLLTGSTFELRTDGLDGQILRSGLFTKGAAREPAASTIISARRNGPGSLIQYLKGQQRDIKINGVLWEMRNNGSAIQPSTPAGNNMTLVNSNPGRWSKIPA